MATEIRTVVEVEIKDVLGMGQAADLVKGISALIDEICGPVSHEVVAKAPFDQTWQVISHGRMIR